ASTHPAVVSWSVNASTSRPAAAADSTRRAGVSVPSEQREWACRSIRKPASPTGAALAHSTSDVRPSRASPAPPPRRTRPFQVVGTGLLLVAEDQFGDRHEDLLRPGQVLDGLQVLLLTGGLHAERAIAQDLARHRSQEAHVGDLADRHHGVLRLDDAAGDH